jgi:hypothetical protein
MSTDLANQNQSGFTLPQQAISDDVDARFEKDSNRFLPYIKLCSHKSNEVAANLIEGNHFGLIRSKEEIEDLGESFECIPINRRYKAMDFNAQPKMVVSFDPDSVEFKEIEERSGEQNSGCQYGAEYLVWLPNQQEFATFWFSGKSSRPESKYMKKLLGHPTTVKWKWAESKTYKSKWPVPRVVACSVPLTYPPQAELEAENAKFNKLIPAEEEGFVPEALESEEVDEVRAR